ncbi:MAG: dihydrodipicolinate synthase family protein [Bryobacteraceae bacterium]
MRAFTVKGVIPALLTPFDAAGAVDLDLLREDAQRLAATGVSGLCVGAFPSEMAGMAPSELHAVCRAVHTSATLPLLVNIYPDSTTEAIDLARAAVDGGATALLVAQPHYLFQPYSAGLVELFIELRSRVTVPILLSNTLPAALVRFPAMKQLIDASAVDGVLQGGGDAHLLADLLAWDSPVPILNGVEGLFYTGLLIGAETTVSILATVFPQACCRLQAAFADGDHQEALRLHGALLRSWRMLDHPAELAWRLKAACRLMGRELGVPRSPYSLSSELSAGLAQTAVESMQAL